jgi:hypothetical protein
LDERIRQKSHADVRLARGKNHLMPDNSIFLDVLHIGEALVSQDLLGHILGGRTKIEVVPG